MPITEQPVLAMARAHERGQIMSDQVEFTEATVNEIVASESGETAVTAESETTETATETAVNEPETEETPAYYSPTVPALPTLDELEITNRFHKIVYGELVSTHNLMVETAAVITEYNKGRAEIEPRVLASESETAVAFKKARDAEAADKAKRDAELATQIKAIRDAAAAVDKEKAQAVEVFKSAAFEAESGAVSISEEEITEALELMQQMSEDANAKRDRLVDYGYALDLEFPTGKAPVKVKRTVLKSTGQKGTSFKPRMANVTIDDNTFGQITAVELSDQLSVEPDLLKAEIMKAANQATNMGMSNSDRTGWDKLATSQTISFALNGKRVTLNKRAS